MAHDPSSATNSHNERISASVTAVIVTFNSQDVIAESLHALNNCADVRKTILVDNASADGTVQRVAEEFPEVQLITSAENVGFGAGNNLGLDRVTTEFAFVLNPDAVVRPSSIAALLRVAKDRPDAAIVGPVFEQPGRIRQKIRTGSLWDPQKTPLPLAGDLDVEFLSGAAMFMRMSLLRRCGFFDPNIFLFHEDDDICRSARQAGYSLILTSTAVVSHMVGQSTPPNPEIVAFKQYHFTWSRLYFEKKVYGQQAATKLAHQTLKELSRKRLIARLMLNRSKLKLLQARTRAVECFLNNQRPSRVPRDFTDQSSQTVAVPDLNPEHDAAAKRRAA